jgi:tetratricopeptide (TPR) repeat protein
MAIKGMYTEMKNKMSEYDFKSLMESTLFTDVFQDLSNVSSKTLDLMAEKIRDVREGSKDLSMSQIRQLAQYLEKVETAKINNGSIKQAVNAIKEAYKLRAKGKTIGSLSDDLAVSEAALDRLNTLKNDITLVLGLKDKTQNVDMTDVKLTGQQQKLYKMNSVTLTGLLATTDSQIDSQKKVNGEIQKGIQTYKDAQVAVNKLSEDISNYIKIATAGIDIITNSINLFGDGVDEVSQVWVDFIKSSIESAGQLAMEMVALGIKVNEASGVIGVIATALTIVAGLFSTILGAHNKKKEQEIKALKRAVEDLERAYEKLEDAIEAAYAIDDYEYGYDQMVANLQKQIKEYNEMLDAAKAKKGDNTDEIREYEQAIEDLQDDLEELRKKRITDLGGFGSDNYGDVAEEFVSTWLDAFKETGDGLDDLNDKWQEYMENLFIKQAAMKKAGTLYAKAMNIIDSAIDSGVSGADLEASIDEARTAAEQANVDLNEYLKALASIFGISQEGESTLSDLQQGISNITEAQAAAIEAYLNSIRFYVASQDAKLSDLTAAIREQYTSTDNPMLSVIKEIRDAIKEFSTPLGKAFKRDGDGYKLRVI